MDAGARLPVEGEAVVGALERVAHDPAPQRQRIGAVRAERVHGQEGADHSGEQRRAVAESHLERLLVAGGPLRENERGNGHRVDTGVAVRRITVSVAKSNLQSSCPLKL